MHPIISNVRGQIYGIVKYGKEVLLLSLMNASIVLPLVDTLSSHRAAIT